MFIITGGAGFIGSALVAALNARGIRDILIVDTAAGHENCPNLRSLFFSDYLSADDFLSQITADKFQSPVEAVFHLGACSATTEMDIQFLTKNNVEYSKSVAAFALEKNARLVHASSAATYGDGSKGFSDDHAKIRTLEPLNPYGKSKQAFDLWALDNGLLEKIVSLKYFNVFGPNEYHKADMRSFVLKGYEQVRQTSKVRLFKSHNPDYKDGCQMRDFLYVKDAVDMTLFFLDNKTAAGVFNIGAGKAETWLDLANALFAAMNLKPNIEFIDMPEILRDKYQYFTQADISKIRAAGYKKEITSLENAVKDYVKNYLIPGRYLG